MRPMKTHDSWEIRIKLDTSADACRCGCFSYLLEDLHCCAANQVRDEAFTSTDSREQT